MRPQDIIRRKRDGASLSREEIAYFIGGLTRGEVADYQASALLMAIFLNGMDGSEQQAFTEEMLHSGRVLDFSDIEGPKVDKHSTGGVGDKTSLVIAPLVAAVGAYVPMISGRGLGHTGGTLDKLEAIPGFRVHLSLEEFREVLGRVGYAMMGQTEEIAPADRKLYALRDATATVEAIPLIVASIMSKKLAAGLDALVLDIKTGSGAFMSTEERARQLAHALVQTGERFGVRTQALITDMNQPLGSAVGNGLETRECIRILRREAEEGAQAVEELSVELAAHMVASARLSSSLEDARGQVRRALESGAALEKFRANVEAQGGDARVCDDPSLLFDLTLHEVKVESPRNGFINHIETAELGNAVAALGGGRVRVEDSVDPGVGLIGQAKLGDEVRTGDVLGLVYGRSEALALEAARRVRAAYVLGDEPPSQAPALIKEVITV
ncbi:MAG TPA: thymidine phosphorylase [Pyrinomonadaceae bacterium]